MYKKTGSLWMFAAMLACSGGPGTTAETNEATETGGATGSTGATDPTTTGGIMTTDPNPTATQDPTGGTAGSSTGPDLCAGVVCMALDQCHVVGECDPMTGECSNPAAEDGMGCDDGDACTTPDTCQTGACVGEVPQAQGSVDQSMLTTSGFLPLGAAQSLAQTFTVGASGFLTGIELAALGCPPLPPGGAIKLVLVDADMNTIAEATAPIEGLPECAAYPLAADAVGPALFDLSSACAQVEAGQVLGFRLELVDVPAGVCDPQMKKCSVGLVGEGCFDDPDCDFQVGAGIDFDGYAGGELLLDGMPQAGQDLQFKTFVR